MMHNSFANPRRAGAIAIVLLSFFALLAAACSSNDDSAALGNAPDASGGKPSTNADGGKRDPDPIPIDEKPKPDEPDEAEKPTLLSVAPPKATVGAVGPTIVATGKGFVPRSIVALDGVPLPTSFASATELRATIPTAKLGAVGSLKIAVTTAAPGGGASTDVDFFVENPRPDVTMLNPLSVVAGAGTTLLTVTGTSFVSGATIQFGTSMIATTFKSSTQLEAAIPQAFLTSSASVPVKVVNPRPGGGTSTEIAFTVTTTAATVTALSPAMKVISALTFELTVDGTGFGAGSSVIFNGAAVPTTLVGSNQVKAQIPANTTLTAGEFPVAVSNPAAGGMAVSDPRPFTVVYPVPSVDSLAPDKILAGSPQTDLVVAGSKFFPLSVITFNGTPANTTFVDATHLKATLEAPQLATAGSIDVRVVNPTTPGPGGGPSTPPTKLPVTTTKPTITTTNPSSIPNGSGDTVVTIFGTNFLADSVVKFKGVEIAATYVDGGKMTFVAPASALTVGGKTVAVSVTNPLGGGVSNIVQILVACDPNNVNVRLTELGTIHTRIPDFATAPTLSRWASTGGTCPGVAFFPASQPVHYVVVQNETTASVALSAWAQCATDGKGDAFMTFYRSGVPPTNDAERKACTGVVSEGGAQKSPESGGSSFCPGLTKANSASLRLAACERAVVQVQTFRAEDPAYSVPELIKFKAEAP